MSSAAGHRARRREERRSPWILASGDAYIWFLRMYYQQVNPKRTDGGDDATARARAFGLEWLEQLVTSAPSYGSWSSPAVGCTWWPACGGGAGGNQERLPASRRACVRAGEVLDLEASTLIHVGLRQGYGLAHGLGVLAAAEQVVEELDAGRG